MRRVLHATALAVVLGLSSAVGGAPVAGAQDAAAVAEIDRLVSEGAALYEQGRYAEAIAPAQRALALAEQAYGADDVRTGVRHAWLGGVAQAAARYDIAEPALLRAHDIAESVLGSDHRDTLGSVNNLAAFYQAMGRYAEAEPLFVRALEGSERVLGPGHPLTLISVNNLAGLYDETGRYAEAEPLFVRALEGRERVLGPDHSDTLRSVHNLAGLYAVTGRYAEAEPLLVRALEGTERVLGPDHPDTLIFVNSLASLYEVTGRYAEAEPLYVRALAVFWRALGPDHPLTLGSLNNLAGLYEATGRSAEAEPLFARALTTSAQTIGLEHSQTIGSLWGFYANQYSLGYSDVSGEHLALLTASLTALDARLDGQAVMPADLENPVSVATRASQALTAFAYARLTGLDAPGAQEPAFQLAQRFRQSAAADALSEAVRRLSLDDEQLRERLAERDRLADELATAYALRDQLRALPEDQRDPAQLAFIDRQIDAARAALTTLVEALERDSPEEAELAAAGAPVALAEAQALLQPGEALVVFSSAGADSLYIAYVVTPNGATAAALDPETADRAAVTAAVEALRAGLDPSGAVTAADLPDFDLDAAASLYAALIAPLEAALGEASHLIIVPDGPLESLSWHALVRETGEGASATERYRATEWLADRYAVTVVPTVGALRVLRAVDEEGRAPASQATQDFLGFGDPQLTDRPPVELPDNLPPELEPLGIMFLSADRAVGRVAELASVPQTGALIEQLAELLGARGRDVFTREDADESWLRLLNDREGRGGLSDYRIVAFATHALTAGEIEGVFEPALVLTPGPDDPDAGAPPPSNDGLVRASEVVGLTLDADLVLLAACNTAAPDGALEGEALSGLARAFFYAGARSLMVSHWPAEATATGELVPAMMAAVEADAVGRAEGLRRAMVALRDDGPADHFAHPALWAPFVIIGEGGAVGE